MQKNEELKYLACGIDTLYSNTEKIDLIELQKHK